MAAFQVFARDRCWADTLADRRVDLDRVRRVRVRYDDAMKRFVPRAGAPEERRDREPRRGTEEAKFSSKPGRTSHHGCNLPPSPRRGGHFGPTFPSMIPHHDHSCTPRHIFVSACPPMGVM